MSMRNAILIVLSIILSCAAALAADAPASFKPLFNGKDLTGWEGDMKLWSFENGEVLGKSPAIKQNEFLASKESYADFVLVFKFKVVNNPKGDANSGMQFRSKRVPNSSEMYGYQADIGQNYWGCLYDESRRKKVLVQPKKEDIEKAAKLDDWNEYEITCDGAHIVLKLNGVVTADYTESDPPEKAERSGQFGLQIHAGGPMEIHVKDVFIKVLNEK